MVTTDPFSPDFFTAREHEICHLLLRGIHPVDIPLHSTMKGETVKTHLKNIYQKTHTGSVQELVLWLVKHGWEVTMEIN